MFKNLRINKGQLLNAIDNSAAVELECSEPRREPEEQGTLEWEHAPERPTVVQLERRAHGRRDCAIPVTVAPVQGSTCLAPGKVINIGDGGLFLRTRLPLEPATALLLTVRDEATLLARVVRVDDDDSGYGCVFLPATLN